MLWTGWTGFCVKRTKFLFGDTHISATPSAMQTLKHFLSPPMYLCCIHNFNKSVFRKRMFSFNQNIDLIWFLSELNTPHQLSLFLWARITRRPYVGHDNLKVELRGFPHHKVLLNFIFMKIIKEHRIKIWKNSPTYLMLLLCSIHRVLKINIDNG